MEHNHFHQISVFTAAKKSDAGAKAAYSIYDMGKLLVERAVEICGVTEHRATIMAVWSAVTWCRNNIPNEDIDVYCPHERVPNELTSVWYSETVAACYEDSDRIESVLRECCYVKSAAFGVCGTHGEYGKRMDEVKKLTN